MADGFWTLIKFQHHWTILNRLGFSMYLLVSTILGMIGWDDSCIFLDGLNLPTGPDWFCWENLHRTLVVTPMFFGVPLNVAFQPSLGKWNTCVIDMINILFIVRKDLYTHCKDSNYGMDNRKSKTMLFDITLWWTYKKLWKITIFHGKIHYFYGHFQLLC